MAVEFDGGVIIGADSRSSTGTYVANRATDKLSKVHERIYCCRSGSSADTQAIVDYVRHFLDSHAVEVDRLPTVKTAAHMFKGLVYRNKDYLSASIIVAGWDEARGGSVYSIPLGGALVKQPYAIGGSGSIFIYGLCDALYRPGMTQAECEEFVLKALSHAMARDGSSGGIIRLAIITADGVQRKFLGGDRLPTRD